jgi:hypothetical protein
MAVHQLQHFALGNDVGRIRQHPHDAHVVDRHHHLESARIEEIADQHAGRIAEHARWPSHDHAASPTIDHIIVQQGRPCE